MAEIAVIHGYAGSGKSTQCTRLVHEGFQGEAVLHVSAGNRLREIRTGYVESRYADIINARDAPSPLPDEVVSGAIFESIQQSDVNPALVLIDGYPRHPQAVEAFYNTLQSQSHRLIGTIAMQVSVEESVKRILLRGERDGEKIHGDDLESYARSRYELDSKTTNLAVAALSRIASMERVDASADTDSVYIHFKASLGRLALQSRGTL